MSVSLCPSFGVGFQAFTTGGLPLNAGLINTYAAGGVIPQATFTASVGNVENSNPIVLGADGRPPNEIWITDGVGYRFDLTDSLSNLIASYDNINTIAGLLAASGGSFLVGFTQSGAGAVARAVQEEQREKWVSVTQFMSAAQKADVAARTALIDVTSAFTAAEAALDATQLLGGTIFLPKGVYLSSWAPSTNGIVIKGVGRLATVIKGNGAGTAALSFVGISRVRVQHLTVDGAAVTQHAAELHPTAGLTQAVEHLWENVYFTGATTDNLNIGDVGNHQVSQLTFINCGAWGGPPSNTHIKIQG